MAKKHRVRARSRRSVEAARRATAPRPPTPEAARPAVRAGRVVARTGAPRASGAPSTSLERAAALERGYVMRDFRRIGVVVAISVGLLVASGVVLNYTLR